MAFRPITFGDYVLFHRLANGGMAEVYLARPKDNSMAESRVLVIKKILPESSTDEEFVEMFKKEVHISLGLANANIIQTYDYGLVDGQYYLAMEYVPGVTLGALQATIIERNLKLPVEHSSFICSQICSALAYTHSYRDPFTGNHHSIIHRDISPQNILVGQIGSVKLFDFGIAKIEDQKGVTKTGMIRGKLSYLSPEQAAGKDLDGRSDLFAVGAVLWELLAGKKLFQAEGDDVDKILRQKIHPPSSVNRLVPKELDKIVMKALQRDRYQRYQLAQDFQRDLHFVLQQRFPGYSDSTLAHFIQELYKSEIEKEEEEIRSLMNTLPDQEVKAKSVRKEKTLVDILMDIAAPQESSVKKAEPSPSPTRRSSLVATDSHRPIVRSGQYAKAVRHQRTAQNLSQSTPRKRLIPKPLTAAILVACLYSLWLTNEDSEKTVATRSIASIKQPVPQASETKSAKPIGDHGLLTFLTTPDSNLRIFDGNNLIYEGETPLERLPLAPGTYQVLIENSLLNHQSSASIVIKKNKTTTISKSLN